ncbi:MAG: hypothetical protein KBH41_14125 [Azonexus sp.]|nr:hypothetical protein [Azonexus sp.]
MNMIRRAALKEILEQLVALNKRVDEIHREEFKSVAALPDPIENSLFGEKKKVPLDNLTRASLALEQVTAHIAAAIIEKGDETCSD